MDMNSKKIAIIGGGNMGMALARGILQTKWATPERIMIAEPLKERLEHIKELVNDYNIDAVVHHSLQFCDPYTIEAFRIEKEIDVPFLSIETDYSQEDVGQLSTRIEALIEMISSPDRA